MHEDGVSVTYVGWLWTRGWRGCDSAGVWAMCLAGNLTTFLRGNDPRLIGSSLAYDEGTDKPGV